jgi:putative ABC transport system permease protein
MIRHLFRIVWNRRRTNLLIAIEIFLSFLVLAWVATFGVFFLDNYGRPLGFTYDNVWSVRISTHTAEMDFTPANQLPFEQTPAGQRARIATLLRLLRDLPEVASATAAMNAPYGSSSWNSGIDVAGRTHKFSVNDATDTFADTMQLHVTRGRWFSPADDGGTGRPTVVNERLARELLGDEDPVGRMVQPDPPKFKDAPPEPPMRIVGVISDFRKEGELAPAGNCVFYRNNLDESVTGSRVPRWLLVRARPGAAGAFEEKMIRCVQQGERDWSFRAQPLARARAAVLRSYLPSLAASGLVAAFLLVMVMMGLTGVLWQTVTQRTREIGLRRAKGATIPNIQHQVLGEVLVLTSLAVAAGSIVVAQVPLLDLLGTAIGGRVYAAGLGLSVMCIYLLSIACAWAPSRLATSVPPAEALRYE